MPRRRAGEMPAQRFEKRDVAFGPNQTIQIEQELTELTEVRTVLRLLRSLLFKKSEQNAQTSTVGKKTQKRETDRGEDHAND